MLARLLEIPEGLPHDALPVVPLERQGRAFVLGSSLFSDLIYGPATRLRQTRMSVVAFFTQTVKKLVFTN